MRVYLSTSEAKYRKLFICEKHYTKGEQKIFDNAKARGNISCKELYYEMRRGTVYSFMALIITSRAAKAFAQSGVTITDATHAMTVFAKAAELYAGVRIMRRCSND